MTQKYSVYFQSTLIAAFFITRIINLDADAVFGWSIGQYQNYDEMFYSMPALNMFHYGTWDIECLGLRFLDVEAFISLPAWNLLQALLLKILSNKIIALRMPAVFAGAGIYLLYLRLLSRLNNKLEKLGNPNLILFILFAAYPLCDTIFYNSNTTNEPTIFRLLFASWLFYIFAISREISKKKAFWIGVLATFSCLFVYLYNTFLPLFAFLFLLQKQHRHTLLSFFGGSFVILLVYIGAFQWGCNLSLGQTLMTILESGVRGNTSWNMEDVFRKTTASIFAGNFLNFSPALLVFFVFGTAGFPMLRFDHTQKLILGCVLRASWLYLFSYIVQSIAFGDFFERKGLMVYIPALILSYLFLVFVSSLSAFKVRSRSLFFIVMSGLSVGLMIYVSFRAQSMEKLGYYQISNWLNVTKNSYIIVSSIFIVSVLVLVTLQITALKKWIAPLILAITMTINAHLIVIHKFLNSRHSFFQTIEDIGRLPPGYFLGNLSYVFAIGNKNHKPFLYLYTPKFMKVPYWYSSVNALNTSVYDKFIANIQDPIYTVVAGRSEMERMLQHYSNAKVVYSNMKYRDVECYHDYRASELSASEINEIYVLRLN